MQVIDPSDPAEVLEAAADALEVYGRTTLTRQDGEGRLCVIGALSYVCTGSAWSAVSPGSVHPYSSAMGALHQYRGDPFIAAWNDSTEDDALVIDTLRRCAKDIRNGEAQ